ncbi:MAG: hypothetical protein P9M00_08770 [Candidatus Tritonobacter lacicola]|nr:hypothetical protein [Candidatus Tritonobacter lacicola]
MANWNEKLDGIEKALREEIDANPASGHTIPFCRLVLSLVGDRGLKYLATRLVKQLQGEGFYVQSGSLEATVLCLLGEFIYCALARSEEEALVIRYVEKDLEYPK